MVSQRRRRASLKAGATNEDSTSPLPHPFLQVFILRNFKSNDFVGAYSKGFAEAFFVSAHSKGFASARVGQGVTIFVA